MFSHRKESLRLSRDALVEVLSSIGAAVKGNSLHCPFHNDLHPSAQIRRSSGTGAWYFYCYVCGIADDYFALRERIEGTPVKELLREFNEPLPPSAENRHSSPPAIKFPDIDACIKSIKDKYPFGVIEEVNRYTNPDTRQVDLLVIRYKTDPQAKKTFAQFTPNGNGWIPKGIPSPQTLPLFNRIRIKDAENIVIVEGEKCVRSLTHYLPEGFAATTVPGGASSAPRGDWQILAGKTIYIWPDNDEPGRKFAKETGEICASYGCKIWMLSPEEGIKEDAADFIARLKDSGLSKEEIAERILFRLTETSLPLRASDPLRHHIKQIYEGGFKAIPFAGLILLSSATKALLPGTVTTIASEPGAGKSFFLLQQCWQWLESGVNVHLLMLEENQKFHLMRALAQLSGHSEVTDTDFIADNAMYVNALYEKYAARLDVLASHLTAVGSTPYTLDNIYQWCLQKAKAGARILVIDPVTVAMTSNTPWLADLNFLMEIKKIAEQYELSVILSTHPRIGTAGRPSLSGLAGGGAYPRFSQTVLWLIKHDPPVKSVYYDASGSPHTDMVSRTIQILKSRNGPGGGTSVAVRLNYNSLCFEELGLVGSASPG